MDNLQIRDQFDSVTFRNKKAVCILEVQNEYKTSEFRLKKSDAISIIAHLQEWVGIKADTSKSNCNIPRVVPCLPSYSCPYCNSTLINYNKVDGWSCDNCDETWLNPS